MEIKKKLKNGLQYLSTVFMAAIPSCPPIAYKYPSMATTHTPLRGLLKGATSALQLSVSGLYLPGVGVGVSECALHAKQAAGFRLVFR